MRKGLKTLLLAVGALATAAGSVAPAAAGGGHGRGYGKHGYDKHWKYDGHRGYWRDSGRQHYRYYRHRRGGDGLSGAEAGLIAAGIVGAAILLDSANDRYRYDDRYDRDRYDDRYYRERYYDRGRYYDPYRRGGYDDRYGYGGDLYYRRDDYGRSGGWTDRDWDDLYDDDLGLEGGSYRGSSYNYGAAYTDCKAEMRDAARDRGISVGVPARPERIERIDGGSAVRFVTSFEVQERGGYRQTMVCEADASGVRFIELV